MLLVSNANNQMIMHTSWTLIWCISMWIIVNDHLIALMKLRFTVRRFRTIVDYISNTNLHLQLIKIQY